MSYVLSIIQPPEGEAKYGKATVIPALPHWTTVRNIVYRELWERDPSAPATPDDGPWKHDEQAWELANTFFEEDACGVNVVDPRTGLTFRMDKSENAPHPCPCEVGGDVCGRLVEVKDHAYAYGADAFCLGCYPWDRNAPGCLPENSGHAAREGEE